MKAVPQLYHIKQPTLLVPTKWIICHCDLFPCSPEHVGIFEQSVHIHHEMYRAHTDKCMLNKHKMLREIHQVNVIKCLNNNISCELGSLSMAWSSLHYLNRLEQIYHHVKAHLLHENTQETKLRITFWINSVVYTVGGSEKVFTFYQRYQYTDIILAAWSLWLP